MAPLTVPYKTHPCVGVVFSPTFCITNDPWRKTFTKSPKWYCATSGICWRSSSVVAALWPKIRVKFSCEACRQRGKLTCLSDTQISWGYFQLPRTCRHPVFPQLSSTSVHSLWKSPRNCLPFVCVEAMLSNASDHRPKWNHLKMIRRVRNNRFSMLLLLLLLENVTLRFDV